MQEYIFKDYVSIVNDEEYLYILGEKVIRIENNSLNSRVINLYKDGTNLEEVAKLIGNEDVNRLHKIFLNNNLVSQKWRHDFKDTIVEKQLYHFEKHNVDPSKLQKEITKLRIGIIGAGGLGSIIVQNLIGAGFSNFTIIDYDEVQIHNLNRQYTFNLESIGKLKVDEIKKYINSINTKCKVTTYNLKINTQDDLNFLQDHDLDLIINAADQPYNISEIVFDYAMKSSVAFITGGVGIKGGFWGPLIDSELYNRGVRHSTNQLNRKPIKGSMGATNSIIASLLAYDIIRYFTGEEVYCYGQKVFIDLKDLTFRKEKMKELI
ncbi:ThiF family adenylyltransferase [Bacillus sp. FJAT-45037]|uniref:ThiF family adenylyltransferase n=1 Tax=Bacillus sp. FJAT-45037 TaxID=2011007 RepID=UPI000C23EBE4|nr:ThiF family adenylyltransferase [Bacillus sp. FJAT-45037]